MNGSTDRRKDHDLLPPEIWHELCEAGTDRPTAETMDLPHEAVLRARAAVRRAATTERLGRRTRRRRVLSVAAVAGVAAAAVLIGVVGLRIDGRDVSTPEAAAAAVLNRAADVALSESDPVVGPGQYLRITLVQDTWNAVQRPDDSLQLGRDGRPAASLTRWTRTLWIPRDPTRPWTERNRHRVLRTTTSDPRFAPLLEPDSTRTVPSWAAPDRPRGYVMTYDPAWYASLPTEPGRLLATIRREIGGEGRGIEYEFSEIYSEVLRSGMAPATVRSAVFRELAKAPGLVVDENATTPQGRPGVAIGFDGAFSQRMVFDRATGRFAGERYTNANFPAVPGIDAARTTLSSSVSTEVVDRAPR